MSSRRACVSTCTVTSIGNQVLVDQAAREVELRLRRRRKADFDFLEAELDEQREHLELLRDGHRLHERLVAVAQIDAAPVGRALDRAARPLPVVERERAIGAVLAVVEVAHGQSLDAAARDRAVILGGRRAAETRYFDLSRRATIAIILLHISLIYCTRIATWPKNSILSTSKSSPSCRPMAALSNQELADRVGLSASPCSRRIHQLEDSGRHPRARRAARAARRRARPHGADPHPHGPPHAGALRAVRELPCAATPRCRSAI